MVGLCVHCREEATDHPKRIHSTVCFCKMWGKKRNQVVSVCSLCWWAGQFEGGVTRAKRSFLFSQTASSTNPHLRSLSVSWHVQHAHCGYITVTTEWLVQLSFSLKETVWALQHFISKISNSTVHKSNIFLWPPLNSKQDMDRQIFSLNYLIK